MAITLAGISGINAQEFGIRGGDLLGGNIGIDGVIRTGEFSRLHATVSFGEHVGAELLWDFIYHPVVEDVLFVYTGAGPFALFEDTFTCGAVGEVGIEYRFEAVPIAMGIDWRPTVSIIEESKFDPKGFGFNIRYILDFY